MRFVHYSSSTLPRRPVFRAHPLFHRFLFRAHPLFHRLLFRTHPLLHRLLSRAHPRFRRPTIPALSLIFLTLFSFGCRRTTDPRIAAIRADSISVSLHHATRFIDSARNILVAEDPGGDSVRVASALLIHTPLGDSVRSAVQTLVTLCHNDWPNPATIINIDNAFRFTKQLLAHDAWDQVYFPGTPTAMAYSLLSSMEDECKSAANFAMFSLDGRKR